MAYCTNPDCRHRQRTGRSAEYQPGTSHCADCGQPLEPGERPPLESPQRLPWPGPLLKRLGLTAAAMALVTLLGWLPHPLLDHAMLADIGAGNLHAGPFGLGVRPLMVGFVLVELGALILPGTRHRRRQDPHLRRKLWAMGALLGVGVAWLQGFSLAVALESMSSGGGYGYYGTWGDAVVPNPGWMFRLGTAAMTAFGVGCMAGLVRWLDRHGLGPGMAALLLADGLAMAGLDLQHQGRALFQGQSSIFLSLLMLLALAGLLAGAWWALGRTSQARGGLPACLPVTGLLPYEIAITLLLIPGTIASFGMHGGDALQSALAPGTKLWVAVAVPVSLLAVPVAATLFYWRRRHWWTGPQRGAWLKLLAASAGLVLLVVLGDAWAMRSVPFLMVGGIVGWLILVALAGDAWTELSAWRAIGRAPVELARHQDLADALEQLRELQGSDPDGHYVLTGLRFRSLTYFFGPYVPLRILGAPGLHSPSVAP